MNKTADYPMGYLGKVIHEYFLKYRKKCKEDEDMI
jgi:hypothetical protein